jgi:hypothetical protein
MADVGSVANKLSTLDGLFKRVYADKLEKLIPYWAILQKDIAFSESARTGEDFMQPVAVKMEHGVTQAASGDGAFTLNAPVSGLIQKAVVTGYQHVIRAAIDYETAYSGLGGERAFKGATATVVESMWNSLAKRLELDLLYGQDLTCLGTVASTASSETILTITDATWAPGIWAGMEGCPVNVWATGLTAKRAGGGTTGTITAVDLDNKAITISATVTSCVATDVISFPDICTAGPSAYKLMPGMSKIVTNTGALFGINATTYNLWKGITHSAGSTDLSFGTIQDAISKIVAKGADSDINVYISPRTWANLMNDQAALRRYDSSANTSKVVVGAQAIEFWGQLGKITIKAHPMIKEGEAYGISPKLWKRIGATDITFTRPPMSGSGQQGQFFRELYDAAGFELRAYSHQALFTHAPGKAFKINNIVNS